MANKNPKTAQLIPITQLDEETKRQRARKAGRMSGIAKRKTKAAKLTLSDVMSRFLVEKFPMEDEDGLVEKVDGQELIVRLMRQELAKGGANAVKLLSVMNDIMQGQPKVMQQINISAHEHNYLDKDRMALFDEIMGNKPTEENKDTNEPIDVEYEVKEVDENGNQ